MDIDCWNRFRSSTILFLLLCSAPAVVVVGALLDASTVCVGVGVLLLNEGVRRGCLAVSDSTLSDLDVEDVGDVASTRSVRVPFAAAAAAAAAATSFK